MPTAVVLAVDSKSMSYLTPASSSDPALSQKLSNVKNLSLVYVVIVAWLQSRMVVKAMISNAYLVHYSSDLSFLPFFLS